MPSMSTPDLETRRRFRLAFALLIAGSAVFRIAYVLLVKRDDPLWSDELFYTNAAVLIAEGYGFQDPFVPTMPSAGHAR